MAKNETLLLEWEAPEYKFYKKNIGWYITFGVLAALLALFWIIRADYFGAITTIIISVIAFFFTRHKPMTITYRLTDRGVYMHDTFINYQNVKSFWIHEDPAENISNATLETNAYLNHLIVLELGDMNPEAVRAILEEYISEHPEIEDTWLQKIMHQLHF